MSESSHRDNSESSPEPPADWLLFLVNAKMRVLAASRAGKAEETPHNDLAEYLAEQGFDLAEVGELLVCLEDLPSDCELRLRLGKANVSVVARGVENVPGLSCVILRRRAAPEEERWLTAAWKWASAEAAKRGLVSSSPDSLPLRVMVVDQNPEVVSYGKTLARKLGCRSEGALSGGEALAAAKRSLFDLVIIDDRIPGMGARVLSQLLKERCDRHWSRPPLVAVMAEEARLRELKGKNLMEKPMAMGDLAEMVRRARVFRHQYNGSRESADAMPVLKLELWEEDKPLLRRLSQALVAQGSELAHRLRVEPGYWQTDDFARELLSLKNGCDILHAKRLAKASQDLLDEVPDLGDEAAQSLIDRLLVEIESFRLFASGNGLLNRE